jgi:uncharacterized protein (DUF433 family)
MTKNGKSHTRKLVGKFLVIDPEICHGQLTFRGTRVPATTVLALMAKGYSLEQMLRSYPEVSHPAIQEAIQLAIASLKHRYNMKRTPQRRIAA